MELENKSIIITGASSGIGAAAALLFAEEGANVVLGARRPAELETLAGTINRSNGRAVYLAGDVKDEAYADALVDLASSRPAMVKAALPRAARQGSAKPAMVLNYAAPRKPRATTQVKVMIRPRMRTAVAAAR